MSTPRLGVVRESMLTNPLLIKVNKQITEKCLLSFYSQQNVKHVGLLFCSSCVQASLGQTRSRGLSVPGPDFTFGSRSSSLEDKGVVEVLSSWRVQSRREDSGPHGPLVPDFVTHRDAVKAGLVTSKELSHYRAKTKCPAPKQLERGGASRHFVIPDITHGVTPRAPSPLSDLLSHQYARHWMDDQLSRNQSSNQKQLHRIKPGADTRTSLLRRGRVLPVTQPLLRPKRCTQVPPALDTFRDQETRLRAFRAHQSESVTRRGHLGLGTYNIDRAQNQTD
ncbi:hypothetical protein JOB18_004469 [Solea senegalensis]|uniref:Cilia- and flagella-associated protein 77 n=1 Tax=Solea senegalensis TaxID=28829 RepID=A0AAV6QG43_SOLSE|nr:hypothetical protein JOB18_004469 [Solea senegalensis]